MPVSVQYKEANVYPGYITVASGRKAVYVQEDNMLMLPRATTADIAYSETGEVLCAGFTVADDWEPITTFRAYVPLDTALELANRAVGKLYKENFHEVEYKQVIVRVEHADGNYHTIFNKYILTCESYSDTVRSIAKLIIRGIHMYTDHCKCQYIMSENLKEYIEARREELENAKDNIQAAKDAVRKAEKYAEDIIQAAKDAARKATEDAAAVKDDTLRKATKDAIRLFAAKVAARSPFRKKSHFKKTLPKYVISAKDKNQTVSTTIHVTNQHNKQIPCRTDKNYFPMSKNLVFRRMMSNV